MKPLLFLSAAVACAGCVSAAELSSNDVHQARIQGTNGLASFKLLIKPATAVPQGFSSTNEIQSAVLGEPFRVYRVPLDRLRAYAPPQDFKLLLTPAPKVIFPLEVHGKTKSSLTVRLEGNRWRTDNWGLPALIKDMTAARHNLATNQPQWAEQSYAVEIPVFNLWFLGYTNTLNNSVEFVTLSALKFGTVTVASAQQVVPVNAMTNLAAMANKYTGLSN